MTRSMTRLMKRIFLLMLVLASLVAAGVAWLGMTESGMHTLARGWLPDNVRFGKLEGRVTGPIRVEQLHIELPGATITVEQVALDWSMVDGHVRVKPLEVEGLDVALKDSQSSTQPQPFMMPVIVEIADATINGIVVRSQQNQWQAQNASFAVTVKEQQVKVTRLTLTTDTLQAAAAGELTWETSEPIDVIIGWKYQHKYSPEIAGKSHFTGTIEALDVEHEASAPFVWTATGSAQPLLESPTWQLNIDIPEFDPSAAVKGWPQTRVAAQFAIQGKANRIETDGKLWFPDWQPRYLALNSVFAVTNDHVVIDDLNLRFEDTPTQASMAGNVSWVPTFEFALNGGWQPIEWPLTEAAQMRSPMGTFQATGNAETYQGSFTAQLANLAGSDVPLIADVEAQFLGDMRHIDFHHVKIKSDDIQAKGIARMEWQPKTTLHAQFDSERINPAIFHTALDGHLSSELAVDVTWQPQGPPEVVAHNRIDGVVNEQPVTGQVQLQTTTTDALSSELELQVGDNTLTATGNVGEQLDLAWTLDAKDLGHLVPELAGQVNSRGTVSGKPETPRIDLTAQGNQLHWQDIELGELNTQIHFDVASGTLGDTHVEMQNVQWKGVEFSSIKASAKGSVADHNIVAELTATEGQLHLRGAGGYDNQQWRGQLLSLKSESERLGSWQLEDPMAIEVNAEAVSTSDACLIDTHTRLCLSGRWSTPQTWSLKANLDQFDVNRLKPWLSDAYDYQGEIKADVQMEQQADQPWQGRATIDLDKAVLRLIDEPTPLTELSTGQLRLLADAKQLDLVIDLDLPQQDRVKAQIHAGRIGLDAPIKGSVRGHLANLDFVSLLAPELFNVSGELVMDLDVTGTFETPNYAGHITLVDGVASVVDAGITIEDIGFKLDGSSNGLGVNGTARSGEGSVNLSGTLDWAGIKPSGHFTLVGERFRLMDLSEVQVDASPDLTLETLGRRFDLAGKVHVDEAHISSVNIAQARITTSPDEVIISETPVEPAHWRVSSQIAVTLGDVTVDAYGLRGSVLGALDIIDLPGQPARATGQLTIKDGYYKAYGQFLIMERGRLVFGGGPLNNPSLDVRAIRHFESVSAGVEVRGPLTNPQMTVFSIPPRPHQYALALLLIGEAPVELGRASDNLAYSGSSSADLDQSMGIGGTSSGLSTYLSPDYYLGYLEAFSMRFRLTRKWSIEIGRSIEASNLGVIYSIR